MNRAFLSHSSEQKDFVRQVFKLLGGKSRCIFDECCFENGKMINDEIEKGMNKSDLFVLFISNSSLNSKWVQREIVLADRFRNRHELSEILPIIIDPNIEPAKDSRIPDWMKSYLMKYVKTPSKAKDMISNALRQLEYANNPYFVAKRNLFIGRYKEKSELERTLNQHIDPYYSTIIMSGLDGIGRRTFLKRFLSEKNFFVTTNEPICIQLGARSSIDDLIIKLKEILYEEINGNDFEELNTSDLASKTHQLKKLIQQIADNNLYVFIIDDGCVVRPTEEVSKWFIDALDITELKECFNICLISKFRPSHGFVNSYDEFISISLGALSNQETVTLFNGYCKALGLKSDPQYQKIISLLNGIPSQIYFAVEMIHRVGIDMAIRNQKNIVENGDRPVMSIINEVKQRGEKSFSLLVLLGNLQTTSFSMLNKIVEDEEFVEKEMEFLYVAGVFSLIGGSKQYIEVHNSISDYIRRSRIELEKEYTERLNNVVEECLEHVNENSEFDDMAILHHSIKESILSGKDIPANYYLPSFTLNAISELYNNQQYKQIVSLIDKMLENKKKYDESTIREYTYWLCQSLIRLTDKRFEKEVEYFHEGADYYFLYGFYYRVLRNLDKAEDYLKTALEYNSNHQRSKRELVNVYIMKGDYENGLILARENYKARSTNPFHIQAYFLCLLYNNLNNIDDIKDELDSLLGQIKNSLDKRAKSISATMRGEYAYNIEKNVPKAIKILKDGVSVNNQFARKSLAQIYRKESMYDQLRELGTC